MKYPVKLAGTERLRLVRTDALQPGPVYRPSGTGFVLDVVITSAGEYVRSCSGYHYTGQGSKQLCYSPCAREWQLA